MAKLPYTYTICPYQEPPKNFTASSKDIGKLLRHSPNGDLTIDQKRTATWDMWSGNHMGHIEEALHEITKKRKSQNEQR
jgi:hypothetical protein